MPRRATAAVAAGLIFVTCGLAGCFATTEAAQPAKLEASRTATAEPDVPVRNETQSSPVATPSTSPSPSTEQTEYEAAIAAWTEPLPPGYSWPAWLDLPHIDPLGNSQLGQADNASGVYRCILIDAAWHDYFENNDQVASKGYAIRADAYIVPDNPSTPPVTQDGLIIESDLAASNGICRGIAGDLDH